MQARPWLGIDHINKTAKRTRYSYQEKAIKIHNWPALCLCVLSVLRHLLEAQHPSAWQLSAFLLTLTHPERFYVLDACIFWQPHFCLWPSPPGRPGGAWSLLCRLTHISSVCKDFFAQHAIFVRTLWDVCSPFSIYMQNKFKQWNNYKKKQQQKHLRVGCEWQPKNKKKSVPFWYLWVLCWRCQNIGISQTDGHNSYGKVDNSIVQERQQAVLRWMSWLRRRDGSGFEFADITCHRHLSYHSLVSTLCLSVCLLCAGTDVALPDYTRPACPKVELSVYAVGWLGSSDFKAKRHFIHS